MLVVRDRHFGMQFLKLGVLALVVGCIFAAIGYTWADSKYPSCDLVVRGIGISTYGCSSHIIGAPQQCENALANSPAIAECVQKNYYPVRYLPFGFTQHFGDHSNLIDRKPRILNTLAMFGLGFVLTLLSFFVGKRIRHSYPSKTKFSDIAG
jgi:hypothetical protein